MREIKGADKIYHLTLYRFGYDLTVVTDNEESGIAALKKEYYDTYKKWNNCRPTKEEWENARESIEIRQYELNKVEWE